MSLRALSLCEPLPVLPHLLRRIPPSLTLLALSCSHSVSLSVSLLLVQIVIYTIKLVVALVRGVINISLRIPLLIVSGPPHICSKSIVSNALSLPWMCVCCYSKCVYSMCGSLIISTSHRPLLSRYVIIPVFVWADQGNENYCVCTV